MPVLDIDALLTLLLVYLRMFSFLLMVPIFGREFIPVNVKLFLTMALSFSVFLLGDVKTIQYSSFYQFLAYAISEISLGFVTGLILRFIFDAIYIAGEIIATSMGLGFLMMFLPQQPQTTVMAGFSLMMGTAIFLSLGGAEILLVGFMDSFKTLPPGGFNIFSINPDVFLNLFYASFSLGVKLSLPVLIASLLTNVILAVVNRFIPQINVFMVGLPVQLMVGFFVFILSLPILGLVVANHMREYIFDVISFLKG